MSTAFATRTHTSILRLGFGVEEQTQYVQIAGLCCHHRFRGRVLRMVRL